MYVQVSLKNPLQIGLPLQHVRLLWSFQSSDGMIILNEETTTVSESIVETKVLDSVTLEANCTQKVSIKKT